MITLFSKSILAAAAFCAVGAGLLTTATTADAARMSCQARAKACERRCASYGGDWVGCITRTCNRQYDNCVGG